MNNEVSVFRSIAFPVSAFDYLKQFQKDYHHQHGIQLNNNQALRVIMQEHQQNKVESEEHGSNKLHG